MIIEIIFDLNYCKISYENLYKNNKKISTQYQAISLEKNHLFSTLKKPAHTQIPDLPIN